MPTHWPHTHTHTQKVSDTVLLEWQSVWATAPKMLCANTPPSHTHTHTPQHYHPKVPDVCVSIVGVGGQVVSRIYYFHPQRQIFALVRSVMHHHFVLLTISHTRTHTHTVIHTLNTMCSRVCVEGAVKGQGGGFLSLKLPSTCGVNMCNAEDCARACHWWRWRLLLRTAPSSFCIKGKGGKAPLSLFSQTHRQSHSY